MEMRYISFCLTSVKIITKHQHPANQWCLACLPNLKWSTLIGCMKWDISHFVHYTKRVEQPNKAYPSIIGPTRPKGGGVAKATITPSLACPNPKTPNTAVVPIGVESNELTESSWFVHIVLLASLMNHEPIESLHHKLESSFLNKCMLPDIAAAAWLIVPPLAYTQINR